MVKDRLKSAGFLVLLLAFVLGVIATPASANSYREDQLSQSLRKSIEVGQAVDLKLENGDKFLIFYTEAFTPKSRGCVILLHGLDGHLDWPQIIGPLRTDLPNYGWNTLSIQLATLGNFSRPSDYQALYRDSSQRIAAAIAFLEKHGIYNIVLVGHSLGGSMGLYHLAAMEGEFNKAIIAFIGIAMYDPDNIAKEYTSAFAIAHLRIPVLDIYGTQDTVDVLNSVNARKLAALRKTQILLQQVSFTGGDHFLTGLENRVQTRVRLWADKRAPSMEIEKKKIFDGTR